MNSKIKSYLTSLIKVAIAIGLILWLSLSGKFDWNMLKGVLLSWYTILFLFLTLVNLMLNNVRWMFLLEALGIKVSFRESFKLSLIGIFFNYMMPGGVGGDLIKGYYIVKRNPGKKTSSATSVLLDRVIGFASMAFLGLVALGFSGNLIFTDWRLQSLGLALLGIFSAFTSIFVISRSTRLLSWLEKNKVFQLLNLKGIPFKILNSFHAVSKRPLLVLSGFVLSLASQTSLLLIVYFASNLVLNIPLGLNTVFFAVPLGIMVAAAPIAPAGVGVGQVAMYSFFEMMKFSDPNVGTTGITIIQIMLFAWGLVGSYHYVKMGKEVKMESELA